ncbi:MAG: hypothetical protein IJ809_03925 [Clostridia bacterium]|nr:hypothetical protein [Clostridia bacterium]
MSNNVKNGSGAKKGNGEINNNLRIGVFIVCVILLFVLIVVLVIPKNPTNTSSSGSNVSTNSVANEENTTVELYKKAIDTIMSANSDKTSNDSYVSLPTDELINITTSESLSSTEKQAIIDYLKKYNKTVYDYNYDELKQKYADENGNFYGSLITINAQKLSNNNIVLNLAWHKTVGDVWMQRYTATFANNTWTLK